MKKVAKLLIVDKNGEYLLLYRDNHPTFGNDPDLPGGTLEEGESTLTTMVREVREEIGVMIDETRAVELYVGTSYSVHGTQYSLFLIKLDKKPEITMSWEHASYEWLTRNSFLEKISGANDTYMLMVHDILKHLGDQS